jgi:hypothetical protein
VGYYFGCEKLAFGLVGIDKRISASSAYRCDFDPSAVEADAANMKLAILDNELHSLFARQARSNKTPDVAREIRNRLFRDFGPTNVGHALTHAPRLIPIMKKFLNCEGELQAQLAAGRAIGGHEPMCGAKPANTLLRRSLATGPKQKRIHGLS